MREYPPVALSSSFIADSIHLTDQEAHSVRLALIPHDLPEFLTTTAFPVKIAVAIWLMELCTG